MFVQSFWLKGLKSLHAEKIVHFDIKPENIMMDDSGICIIDFDCSMFEKDVTEPERRGTRDYMAPEILIYQLASTKSDIYSVAIVFGEMISHLLPHWHSLLERHQPTTIQYWKENVSSLSG